MFDIFGIILKKQFLQRDIGPRLTTFWFLPGKVGSWPANLGFSEGENDVQGWQNFAFFTL